MFITKAFPNRRFDSPEELQAMEEKRAELVKKVKELAKETDTSILIDIEIGTEDVEESTQESPGRQKATC